MNEELVEMLAEAINGAAREGIDAQARAVLEAIESSGMVIVPRENFDALREFVEDISEDQYTQGVPWRQAQSLLKRIAAAPK